MSRDRACDLVAAFFFQPALTTAVHSMQHSSGYSLRQGPGILKHFTGLSTICSPRRFAVFRARSLRNARLRNSSRFWYINEIPQAGQLSAGIKGARTFLCQVSAAEFQFYFVCSFTVYVVTKLFIHFVPSVTRALL